MSYGHGTHNCPGLDRREGALELSGCYLETFAGGCQEPGGFAGGCAAYLASSEPRDPPCPLPPRAHLIIIIVILIIIIIK